jgi:hypothetical protein
VDRRVRVLLDLLSLAESVPTRGSPLLSYLLAPREAPPQVKQPDQSFNSLLESSGSATPPGGYSRSPGP